MKYFEEYFICPNCGKPLYKKSVMQDEDTREERFCGRCGFDIAAAKTEALKQIEETAAYQESNSKIRKKDTEGKDKDEFIAEKIFEMLLNSYAPDGISVRGAGEILNKVHEMFECTAIVPIDEERICQLEQINVQAGEDDITRIAKALSQKIQELP